MKWGTSGRASVIVGGNWGSEGKGLVAAYLAQFIASPVGIATTNAGAQAGHTTKFRKGPSFVCYHLPTTFVVKGGQWLAYLNGGSIIDPSAFQQEVIDCNVAPERIVIHPNAAVITTENKLAEMAESTTKIASTRKGVGAALADKVMRRGAIASKTFSLEAYTTQAIDLNRVLADGMPVVIEVPQGLELSINHGHEYPYVTSRDCWVGSGLNDAGIHPDWLGPVAMVVRTHPIRVGGIYNDKDELLGTSGPFYPDQEEMSWAVDFPGIEPERTTVTKRVRRIATWSPAQYEHAVRMNRPDMVFLTFCDYLKSADALRNLEEQMCTIEKRCGMFHVRHLYGFGPHVEDMISDFDNACDWYSRVKV